MKYLLRKLALMVLAMLSAANYVSAASIIVEKDAGTQGTLAAKEIRRYVYLRTGELLPIVEKQNAEAKDESIVLAIDNKLDTQAYRLKTEGRTLTISGGSDIGVLYGAYAFLEKLGIRFYLHQDVIPDEKVSWRLPQLDETRKPVFKLRGLNPWGSHAEGNDLWNADEYKAVFTQMTKMRMNSMLMHSYPGVPFSVEPAVWVGLPEDVEDDGRVKYSPTASYWNTMRNKQWGYLRKDTGAYSFGGSLLFETDQWGSEVMRGHMPYPTTPEGRNEVFNRMGALLRDAYTFARALGVKTSLGSEGGIKVPNKFEGQLTLKENGPPVMMRPANIRKRLAELGKDPNDPAVIQEIYEGIFTRIARTHPLDYYVIHTQESWYWNKPGNFSKDMFDMMVEEWQLALAAWEKVKPPFGLVACGWVLGPDFDHAAFDKVLPKNVPISEMSRAYNGFVDEAFGRIEGREKWSIPWIEEDSPILTPQLWAGRVRKDARMRMPMAARG